MSPGKVGRVPINAEDETMKAYLSEELDLAGKQCPGKNQLWPRISIITPSYNQEEFIEETILSVKNQVYSNFEHIIVDGGSTDGTLEILKKYENTYDMRWISEPDEGQSDAVNKGFSMADGEIIGWLNSDDVYFSIDVFSKVAAEFLENSKVDVVYGNRIVIDGSNNLVKVQYSREFNYDKLLKSYYSLYQETVFFRGEVVKQQKLNADFYITMDSEFWLRLGSQYNFRYVNTFFGGFRVHKINKTVVDDNISRWNKEKRYLIEKYGARRYMINNKFPWLRLHNQLKALFLGGYIMYYQLPLDVADLLFSHKKNMAFPLKVERRRILHYMIRSITPWLK